MITRIIFHVHIVGSVTKPRNYHILQNHVFNTGEYQQSNAATYKTLHAISNGKLVFYDFPKARTRLVKIISDETLYVQ